MGMQGARVRGCSLLNVTLLVFVFEGGGDRRREGEKVVRRKGREKKERRKEGRV